MRKRKPVGSVKNGHLSYNGRTRLADGKTAEQSRQLARLEPRKRLAQLVLVGKVVKWVV